MSRVRNVIFLSAADAADARKHCPTLNTLVVPPVFIGASVRRKRSGRSEGFALGMLANFHWWPNDQALNWFMVSVFPHLNQRIHLHLFGNGSKNATPDHPRVEKHGFLASLNEVWSTCDLMVCPILSGSGVCVKLAEAVANGMPVLATSFASRGLPLAENPALVSLDKAEDWVAFLNSDRAERLARRSPPSQIVKLFWAETHADAVAGFIESVVTRC